MTEQTTSKCIHCQIEKDQLIREKVCLDCYADSVAGYIDFSKQKYVQKDQTEALTKEEYAGRLRMRGGLFFVVTELEEGEEPTLVDFEEDIGCSCPMSSIQPIHRLSSLIESPLVCLTCGKTWTIPRETLVYKGPSAEEIREAARSGFGGGIFRTGPDEAWEEYYEYQRKLRERRASYLEELAEEEFPVPPPVDDLGPAPKLPGKEGYSATAVYRHFRKQLAESLETRLKAELTWADRLGLDDEASLLALQDLVKEVLELDNLNDQVDLLREIDATLYSRSSQYIAALTDEDTIKALDAGTLAQDPLAGGPAPGTQEFEEIEVTRSPLDSVDMASYVAAMSSLRAEGNKTPTHAEIAEKIQEMKARKKEFEGFTRVPTGEKIQPGDYWYDRDGDVLRPSAPKDGYVSYGQHYRTKIKVGKPDAHSEHRAMMKAKGPEVGDD